MGGIWTFFLERSRVVWLIVLGILLFGFSTFNGIPRETTPTIEIPAASVSTVWPGASTTDTEKLITDVLERKIDSLENLETYSSVSRSGLSLINVEFEAGTDNSENLNRLREKIDEAEGELPDGVPDNPKVSEVSISDIPILTLSLSGDFAWSELKQFASKIEDLIEAQSQVKSVRLAGQPTDAWHIFLDPLKLQASQISVGQVISAIRQGSQELPLGTVKVDGQNVSTSLQAKLSSALDFMTLPVANKDGTIIRLQDIGSVRKEFDEFRVETFFMTKDKAEPAVSIDVIKSASKGNAITMTENILAKIEEFQAAGQLPESLKIDTTYNRADEIKDSLGTLTKSGSQTLLLIFLVMLVALGWRESLLASVSIPLAMLVAIIGLAALGETFNGISLFALVLAVGLLVDNAIIVVEGMHEAISRGLTPKEAAVHTIKTFRWPILTGTLTTVFAFLPMLFFITGISGDYIRIIPITIMLVLGGAFFISLLILPNLGVQFYSLFKPKEKTSDGILGWVLKKYSSIMHFILKRWWVNLLIILSSIVVLVFSVSLLTSQKVPVEVFPASDSPYFVGEVTLPEGTDLSVTKSLIEPISEAIKPFFDAQENGEVWLESVVYTAGRQSGLVAEPGGVSTDQENILGIAFNLTDVLDRETKSYDIVPLFEEAISPVIPDFADYRSVEQEGGPPSGAPIEIRVQGQDVNRLEALVVTIREKLADVPDLVNLRDNRTEKTLQVNWTFDRETLSFFGFTPASIAETLRAAINGVTLMQITEGGEEIDVDLRLDWKGNRKWSSPSSLKVLSQIPIETPGGEFINLEQIAKPNLTSPQSEVIHKDGTPVFYVRANLPQGVPASVKAAEINNILAEIETLPGETLTLGGEAEEGNRLIREMSMAMGFAVLLILLVLVLQFNSFHQSIMVLVLIPLSLTGVFIGFWLTGRTITFPTMIGIVSLAGIIVNDAIVLVDQLNQKRKTKAEDKARELKATGFYDEKQAYNDALVFAGASRFQPIFLTSITTVFGMLPLSLSDEVWGGLGFAIIYGMLISTILCLLLLPSFLRFYKDIGRMFASIWRGIKRVFGRGEAYGEM